LETTFAVFEAVMKYRIQSLKYSIFGFILIVMTPNYSLAQTDRPLSATVELAAAASKSEAAEQARAQFGGKVLSVETVTDDLTGKVYRVKLLLKGGRIKIVLIEASDSRAG
jgi:uncharacterized membrane protein YkoI